MYPSLERSDEFIRPPTPIVESFTIIAVFEGPKKSGSSFSASIKGSNSGFLNLRQMFEYLFYTRYVYTDSRVLYILDVLK